MAEFYEGESDYLEDSEEDVDHNNYKGIYFDEEPGQKFQDPETGAHFEFKSMCLMLEQVKVERRQASVEPVSRNIQEVEGKIHKTFDDSEPAQLKQVKVEGSSEKPSIFEQDEKLPTFGNEDKQFKSMHEQDRRKPSDGGRKSKRKLESRHQFDEIMSQL